MIPTLSDFQALQIEINELRLRITELETNNQALFNFWQQAYQRALPLQEKERPLLNQVGNCIANTKLQIEQRNYEQALMFLGFAQKALETLQETKK